MSLTCLVYLVPSESSEDMSKPLNENVHWGKDLDEDFSELDFTTDNRTETVITEAYPIYILLYNWKQCREVKYIESSTKIIRNKNP
jgi:hypothetical protein